MRAGRLGPVLVEASATTAVGRESVGNPPAIKSALTTTVAMPISNPDQMQGGRTGKPVSGGVRCGSGVAGRPVTP